MAETGHGGGNGKKRRFFKKKSNRSPNSNFNSKQSFNNKSISKDKKLSDYKYFIGQSNHVTNDVHEVTNILLKHIQTTFINGLDIKKALKDRKDFYFNMELPLRRVSSDTDVDKKKAGDETYDLLYKSQLKQYSKRLDIYLSDKSKAYGLVWKHCDIALQTKIKARTNFSSNIEDKPIELLSAIEEHALNFESTRYDTSILIEAEQSLITIR